MGRRVRLLGFTEGDVPMAMYEDVDSGAQFSVPREYATTPQGRERAGAEAEVAGTGVKLPPPGPGVNQTRYRFAGYSAENRPVYENAYDPSISAQGDPQALRSRGVAIAAGPPSEITTQRQDTMASPGPDRARPFDKAFLEDTATFDKARAASVARLRSSLKLK